MLDNNNKNEKINTKKINEVLKTSNIILKILLVLSIFALCILLTFILKEWMILDFIGTILSILSPLFIGIVIAWLLDPGVRYLENKGVNRTLATFAVFIIFLSALVLLVCLLIPALGDQINDMLGTIPGVVQYLSNWLEGLLGKLQNLYDFDVAVVRTQAYETINNIFNSITVDLPNTIVNLVKTIVSGGLDFIFGLFIAFYLLFDFGNVRKHLLTFLPNKLHADTITLTDRLNNTLKKYVQGTLLIMLILFVFQSVGFTIAGLSAPLVFGLFCAVTNVIPYIGPYIGGIPAIIVGFTISPMTGIGCLISVLVCQSLESYFINPLVMSKTMKLHPVTIMLGLLIFGHFFGILGMILATPLISCLKVLVSYFNEKYEILDFINKE